MDQDAIQILKEEYQLKLIDFDLLRERGSRKVWFIRTNKGEYCFKKYDLELSKYLFSFELQNSLMRQNSNIPRIIRTYNDQLYALDQNGRVYVLFAWIKNAGSINLQRLADLKRSLTALARFHRDAMHFSPPSSMQQGRNRYRLNTKKENHAYNKLMDWDEKTLRRRELKYYPFILEVADGVLRNMEKLSRSGDLEEEAQKRYIAHNDFADINILATKDKTYIIDLDTASYNFPTVDFANIYIKTCTNNRIPPNILPLWLKYYESVFPLSHTLKRSLIYQLQFPAIYYRSLLKPHLDEEELYNWELEKNKVLQSLL